MSLPLDEFEARLPAVGASEWRRRLAADETMLGLWLAAGSATVAEILGSSGADWFIIDAEHSPQTLPEIVHQLRALEAARVFTVVRASSKDPLVLGRLLDLGARGVMVPMVETAEEATAVVAATRYPPRGRRGVGTGFARGSRWNGIADYLARAEDAQSLIVQIETVAGIHAVGDIVEVDGVDAIFIGPADLAASAGLPGQPRHPDVQRLIERAIAAVRAKAKVAGVNAFDAGDVHRYRRLGARLFGIGADVTILRTGACDLLAGLRSDPNEADA
jgi:4-hydroxy-2-oxoheptanedioate aldolase